MVDGWTSLLQAILAALHSLTLPAHCVLCGARGQAPTLDLCAPCAADLPLNGRSCSRCAEPFADAGPLADAAPLADAGPFGDAERLADTEPSSRVLGRVAPPIVGRTSLEECGRCAAHPPSFDRAVAPLRYEYPVDRMIQRFKYAGALSFGRVLGMLLAAAAHATAGGDAAGKGPQVLLPVPLHPDRHRERGFNQALELARPVSRLLRLPIDDRLCRRVRNTADQTGLLAGQRRKNLRRAFAVVRAPQWTHVALLDDVLTTRPI